MASNIETGTASNSPLIGKVLSRLKTGRGNTIWVKEWVE
jgi:hypothetical protein